MKKRIVCLLLCIGLCLSGCSDSSISEDTPKKKTSSNVEKEENKSFEKEKTETAEIDVEEEIPEETSFESLDDKYTVKKDFPHMTSGNELKTKSVEGDDPFWIIATEKDSNTEFLLCVDVTGKIYHKFEKPEGTLYFAGDYIVIENYVDSYVYDFDGNDVTEMYVSDGEEIIEAYYDDVYGSTLWTYKGIDTYDSHDAVFTAKGKNGVVKAEFVESKLFEKHNLTSEDVGELLDSSRSSIEQTCYHFDGPWYRVRYGANSNDDVFFLNGENGSSVYGGGVVGDSPTNYEQYVTVRAGATVRVYDNNGNEVPFEFVEGHGDVQEYLGENLFLYCNRDGWKYSVFDINGNQAFDENKCKDISKFVDGYAQVNMVNEAGIKFTSLINPKGEFLFDPIQVDDFAGSNSFASSSDYNCAGIFNGDEYFIGKNGDIIKWINNYCVYITENGEVTGYVEVVDGKLVSQPFENILLEK